MNEVTNLSFLDNKQAALNFYNENGYFIEHNLFTPDECDKLIEASQTLPSALDKTFKPFMMPHRLNDIFLKAMAYPKLVDIMSILVNGEVSGLQTEFFFCKPGTRGFSLHQDNFFVEADKEVFASAWIALTDVYKDKGSLIAYPGTHKEDLLPTRKIQLEKDSGQDPNANNEEVIVPENYSPMDAIVPKGSVFFIHGNLVHGSNPNITNDFRYVLLCTYIRKGEKFRPGRYAQRAEVNLYNIDTTF
ncbi:MAG: phytanoyl-CoA dioxygenase family protein [Sphingobacteriia bacterium]|nr:phytanoyl-CoA dioxygenase family protein [Sphingobacteriia bacterium]